MKNYTKVLVIDDHPVTHIGCQYLLRDLGFNDIFEATTCEQGIAMVEKEQPDLSIVDIGLGGIGGLALIENIIHKFPKARMLAFSMHNDSVFAAKALQAGALGFLTKSSSVETFRSAVETVLREEVFLEHTMATQIAMMNVGPDMNPLSELTRRELQILQLIGEGKNHNQIANQLYVSYKTVANSATLLKSKLGVKSLPELMRIAIEHI